MPRKAQGKRVTTADGTVAVRGKAPNGAGNAYPIADIASFSEHESGSAITTR